MQNVHFLHYFDDFLWFSNELLIGWIQCAECRWYDDDIVHYDRVGAQFYGENRQIWWGVHDNGYETACTNWWADSEGGRAGEALEFTL